jgi:hypothetical protein
VIGIQAASFADHGLHQYNQNHTAGDKGGDSYRYHRHE